MPPYLRKMHSSFVSGATLASVTASYFSLPRSIRTQLTPFSKPARRVTSPPQTLCAAMSAEEAKLVGMVPAAGTKHVTIGRIMSHKKLGPEDGDSEDACRLYVNPHQQDIGRLEKVDWVQALLVEPKMHVVLACAAMNPDPGVDPDHLFLGLLRQDIISDVMFLFNPDSGLFHTLIAMGPDVCGHPCTVHGGFTSAVIDETTGGLVFSLKKNNRLGPGPAFTVRLEVDYKKPIPAGSNIICTAKVESVEGRKAWISAEVMDQPGGVVYASGRALYVTPRQYVEGQAAAPPAAAAAAANGTH